MKSTTTLYSFKLTQIHF